MKKWKNQNFGQALVHATNGIKYAFKNERNLKIQIVFAVFVIIAAIVLPLSVSEILILGLTIGIVLLAEMMNTAIEIVLDLYTEKYDEKVKIAKDVSSGAVLIIAIMSVIIGCIIFLPKLIVILK